MKSKTEPEFTIHIAGPMSEDGLQTCERCGEILVDYRFAMTMSNDNHGFGGWNTGHVISIGELLGNKISRVGRAAEGIDCNARPN